MGPKSESRLGRKRCHSSPEVRTNSCSGSEARDRKPRKEQARHEHGSSGRKGKRDEKIGIGTKIEVQTLALTGMVGLLKGITIEVGVGLGAETCPRGIKVVGTPWTGDPLILETAGITDAPACFAACKVLVRNLFVLCVCWVIPAGVQGLLLALLRNHNWWA